jgi:hypothetical protein
MCAPLDMRILIANSCTSGAESLYDSHSMWGEGLIFLETSAPHSFMTTYQMNIFSARSISLDSTFKFTLFSFSVLLREQRHNLPFLTKEEIECFCRSPSIEHNCISLVEQITSRIFKLFVIFRIVEKTKNTLMSI